MALTDSETATDARAVFDRITDKSADTTRAEPAPAVETESESETAGAKADRERDERGRFAAKAEETADEAATGERQATTDTTTGEQRGAIPSGRLREEADRARRAEAERDDYKRRNEELASRFADYDRRLAELRPREAPKPVEVPDVVENPQGYASHVQGTVEQMVQKRIIDMSFADAHDTHGKVFEDAFRNLQDAVNGGDAALKARIINAPNPGKALMRWHRDQVALKEIGGDFESYRKRITEDTRKAALADPEFRKQAMEAWRLEAGGQPARPQDNVTNLPSVNRATGSGSNAGEEGEGGARGTFERINSRRR
jgi:hypothetical protein